MSELLHLNAYEAAKQINSIFNLGIDFGEKVSYAAVNKYQQKNKALEAFKKWENQFFQDMCDYYLYLRNKQGIDIEKYHEIDRTQYYIDMFIYGTQEDKLWFYKHNKKRSGTN